MQAGQRTVDWSCEQCGMAFEDYGPGDLAQPTRGFPETWSQLTAQVDDETLRQRPDESTWSAMQYGAHIGDGLDWMVTALERTRGEDHPEIEFISPDRVAQDRQYNKQPYDTITERIDDSSRRLAAVLEEVDEDEWSREATYAWGDRDLLDMARNAVHEGVHHLHDVERVLERVSKRQ